MNDQSVFDAMFIFSHLLKCESCRKKYQEKRRYARIRVDWQFTPSDSRNEIGSLRTKTHNAFIDSLR